MEVRIVSKHFCAGLGGSNLAPLAVALSPDPHRPRFGLGAGAAQNPAVPGAGVGAAGMGQRPGLPGTSDPRSLGSL